jgi:ubiquitin-activating enzyme E1-like protein 2
LKSFPSNIEHCIEWSRDKFESIFTIKPANLELFFKENSNIQELIFRLKNDSNSTNLSILAKASKLISKYCFIWDDCLLTARIKFEKYFTNKAKNLLNAYPLNHQMADGSLFWKLPKRAPKPVIFDEENKLHIDFIIVTAKLIAFVYSIDVINDSLDYVKEFLKKNKERIPVWCPTNKKIEIDETVKKELKSDTDSETKDIDQLKCIEILQDFSNKLEKHQKSPKLNVIRFEKDIDANGHVSFIQFSSNLRATMYSIENADFLFVKKISGKIVPAIATTTSCIAGLASIQLVKILQSDQKLEYYRNAFLNLALPLFVLSEPGSCIKTRIAENCYVTLWDKWFIKGSLSFTLKDFIAAVKDKYKLTVSGKLL